MRGVGRGVLNPPQTLHAVIFSLLLFSLPIYYILFNNKKYIKDDVEGVEGVEGCVELDRQPLKKFLENLFPAGPNWTCPPPPTHPTPHTPRHVSPPPFSSLTETMDVHTAKTSTKLPDHKKERQVCVCGCRFQKQSFPAHLLSQRHVNYVREMSKTKVEVGKFIVSL